MTSTITGRMTDPKTIKLDAPLITNESEIVVKLTNRHVRKKITAPEAYVLDIAITDLEELY